VRASAKRPRVNSLCADSNAVRAAASSKVGCGGGGRGCFLTGRIIDLARTRRGADLAAFVGRFDGAFARDFGAGLAEARLGAVFFEVTFVALFARALPAGERLVAGLSRVDLATRLPAAAVFPDDRPVEREDSLFSGLLIAHCDNAKT